jgi:hypothetical protein
MKSYWFEKVGKMWVVYCYRDLERLYAVQSCFTRREAKRISEKYDNRK